MNVTAVTRRTNSSRTVEQRNAEIKNARTATYFPPLPYGVMVPFNGLFRIFDFTRLKSRLPRYFAICKKPCFAFCLLVNVNSSLTISSIVIVAVAERSVNSVINVSGNRLRTECTNYRERNISKRRYPL